MAMRRRDYPLRARSPALRDEQKSRTFERPGFVVIKPPTFSWLLFLAVRRSHADR